MQIIIDFESISHKIFLSQSVLTKAMAYCFHITELKIIFQAFSLLYHLLHIIASFARKPLCEKLAASYYLAYHR